MFKRLYFSCFCLIAGIFLAFFLGGLNAAMVIVILSMLEVSMSFDNAVLNASILNKMTIKWRNRFLTWGILIAVFGMRLLFPISIIAIFAKISLVEASYLAFTDFEASKSLLLQSHVPISAFGGMFLIMVFLDFMLNKDKVIHWIVKIEIVLKRAARFNLIRILLALSILFLFALFNKEHAMEIIVCGFIGILLQITIINFISYLNKKFAEIPTKALIKSSAMSFVYLELLDASFSLDGVLGAFAITKDIMLIFIGLGIGAIFVRSLTIILVEKEILQKYQYIEHAAHYALGALGLIMLLSMKIHINEVIPSIIGITLIILALLSSIYRK